MRLTEFTQARARLDVWLSLLPSETMSEAQIQNVNLLIDFMNKADLAIEELAIMYVGEVAQKKDVRLEAALREIRDLKAIIRMAGMEPNWAYDEYKKNLGGYGD